MDNNECQIKYGDSGTPFVIQKGAWGGFYKNGLEGDPTKYIMVDENGGPSTNDFSIPIKTDAEAIDYIGHFWPSQS